MILVCVWSYIIDEEISVENQSSGSDFRSNVLSNNELLLLKKETIITEY